MTTDNRTNEQIFKEAWLAANDQGMFGGRVKAGLAALRAANRLALPPGEDAVERAAKAIFDVRDDEFDLGEWGDLDAGEKERYICDARAALAVAGTAPQAESDDSPASGNHATEDALAYLEQLREQDHIGYVSYASLHDHITAIATPVQPSSTVDEGKIADEMERHRHVMVAPGPHQCSCGFVMPEDPGFSGWAREHKLHVARAVVEAIGGESR